MYSIERAVEIVAQLGFKYVEVSAIRPGLSYPDDYTRDEVLEFRDHVRSNGLKVGAIHTDDGSHHTSNLTNPNEKIRCWKISQLKISAELASLLDADLISTTCGYSMTIETPREKAWRWAVNGLTEAGKAANAYGVAVALEPAPGTIIRDSKDGMQMIEEIKLDNVNLLLDTGHAMISSHGSLRENGPDLVESIRDAGKHLIHVHIDDNDGTSDQHSVPGTGLVDFEAVIAALKDIDYHRCLSFEISVRDPRKGLRDSKRYLEKFTH
jgi:sugar phosphate isomerase/epimerase